MVQQIGIWITIIVINKGYIRVPTVEEANDMISWIKFFLEATIETAKNARIKFQKVVEFTAEMNKVALTL